MKYVNKLTDKQLNEIFKSFLFENDKFVSLEITRFDHYICLDGIIKIQDDEEPYDWFEIEDSYELTDYHVRVYSHSGNVTQVFRKYMYDKFGDSYAKDYLLGT